MMGIIKCNILCATLASIVNDIRCYNEMQHDGHKYVQGDVTLVSVAR